ncbi:MAG: hypothetical protein L6N94_05470 [Candidatus Methylarchaceae archaeon HK01M]|nr:hypothetical protein [Candidatus Methylarchaceae archaeon HK01M]
MSLSNWVRKRNEEKEKISRLAPEDRLGYIGACAQCLIAIEQSNRHWLQRLSNPSFMSKFDEATLRVFFKRLKELALDNIEFDVEATRKDLASERKGRGPYA